jgi:hypothetical protein
VSEEPETLPPTSGDEPPELPPVPPPPAPPGVSDGNVVLGVFALLAGLFLLVPGGICTVSGIAMQANDREASQIGCLMGGIGGVCLALGALLVVVAWRRFRRKRA